MILVHEGVLGDHNDELEADLRAKCEPSEPNLTVVL